VEAFTFLTLYLNPLFTVSLLLMVGFLIGLLDSESSAKPAALSGICGLVLGNIHGYDVITLTAIWLLYLITRTLANRRIPRNLLAPTLIAFMPAFLSAGYQYFLLKSNPVFAARVNVPTLSPPLLRYVLGFGLLIPLALAGATTLRSRGTVETEELENQKSPTLLYSSTPLLFLASWAVANLGATYLPVPFQRKMVMGLHLPLCILAGAAIGAGFSSFSVNRWRLALGSILLVTTFTNLRFLWRDIEFFQANLAQSLIQRPFLMQGERQLLAWLRTSVKPGTAVQPLPWIPIQESGRLDTTLAAFAPGLTGLPVAAGHWGETPNFGETIKEWGRFARGMPAESANELLQRTGVRYVISSQKLEPALPIPSAYLDPAAPLLRRIPEASNDDANVYEVLTR
jgi:hypothetical protein